MAQLRILAGVLLVAVPVVASADLKVNATRVVYQDGSATASNVRVHNIGKGASLIQAWLDSGDSDLPLEQLRAPLLVTPPIFRLDAGGNRDLQIRAADTSRLPKDRESLLWLNILDVPSRQTAADQQQSLEFAMRWRLKVFHRPSGLTGSTDSAAAGLQWRLYTDTQGHRLLQAVNATPYYVSLAQLVLDKHEVDLDASTAQVPPFGQWTQPLRVGVPPSPALKLVMTWIDEKGTEHHAESQVVRAD